MALSVPSAKAQRLLPVTEVGPDLDILAVKSDLEQFLDDRHVLTQAAAVEVVAVLL